MTPEAVETFVAARDEAWARRDALALVAQYADDCVVESPVAGTIKGLSAVERVYRHWFTAFPDLTYRRDRDVVHEGNRVVQTVVLAGTDTGGFLGQAPTGKPFIIRRCVILFTFDNGKVVHERRVYDLNNVMMQLATGPVIAEGAPDEFRTTLERARMEQDLKIAAEIQRVLLPERHHRTEHFEVSAAWVPCRAIGGDFFDYFAMPDDAFGLALADVAGKGPPAALLAAQVQGVLAAHSSLGGTPATTVHRVNEVLVRRPVAARFATLFYAVLSRTGCLTYCNAGHNPPLLINGHSVRRLDKGGLILGAFERAAYEEEAVQLGERDLLVAFSDGVTEAMNVDGNEFGEERLESCAMRNRERSSSLLLDCVLETIREFRVGAVQNDDLTLVILRYLKS